MGRGGVAVVDGVCWGTNVMFRCPACARQVTYNKYKTIQFTVRTKLRHLLSCAGGPRLVHPYFNKDP